jgi:hypothetical protein
MQKDTAEEMIQAKHTFWADLVFRIYLTRSFKRHFLAFHLMGEIPPFPADQPLILLPNHSTWWDGFFVYFLNKKFMHRTVFLMMLERQLSRFHFFARIGAYSIDPHTFRGVRESVLYTRSLIASPSKPLICIFPQGELCPWHQRPLYFKKGLDLILKKNLAPVSICPLAIRVEFLQEQRPEVFFLFGKATILDRNSTMDIARLEKEETALLDQIAENIGRGEKGKRIFQGIDSVHETWHNIKRAVGIRK